MEAIKCANETSRSQTKNTLDEINSSLDNEEENISEVEVIATETVPNETAQRQKKTENK